MSQNITATRNELFHFELSIVAAVTNVRVFGRDWGQSGRMSEAEAVIQASLALLGPEPVPILCTDRFENVWSRCSRRRDPFGTQECLHAVCFGPETCQILGIMHSGTRHLHPRDCL